MPHRARDWTSGFSVLGVFAGILGSLLVAWQYHIATDSRTIGLHFLGLNAGYVAGAALSQRLLQRFPLRWTAVGSCILGGAALIFLAFVPPPWPAEYRIAGLSLLGLASGGLGGTLLHVMEPYFRNSPAWAINITGAMFGLGCTLATATVAATYFVFGSFVARAAIAGLPFSFAVLFWKSNLPSAHQVFSARPDNEKPRTALTDLRSVAATFFSLLLFVQSGNEWVIAGWLPLFLIRRLGTNPLWAILALAIYFLALTVGRLASRRLLPAVSHSRLLIGGTALAMVGYLLLSLTSTVWLAFVAVITIGTGFAPIYPLLAETLDERFSYHPGFYNGLFTIAITGAMCTPWLIGYADALWGIQYLMLLPAFGSVVVLALTLSLMLEARFVKSRQAPTPEPQREPEPEPAPKAAAAAAGAGKR